MVAVAFLVRPVAAFSGAAKAYIMYKSTKLLGALMRAGTVKVPLSSGAASSAR